MIIRTYGPSNGALAIKRELVNRGVNCLISHRAPKRQKTMIVNWGGVSKYDQAAYPRVLNRETRMMTNKLSFFQHVGYSPDVLEWTTDPEVAKTWKKVVCRTLLSASEGRGIIIWEHNGELPHAPLYTRYNAKTHEYRIHSFKYFDKGGPIVKHIQRKVFVKTPERPEPLNWNVRSWNNGFIFQHEEIVHPPVAIATHKIHSEFFSDLDFCAFDVLYNDKSGRALVIEGNTAPGVEGKTVSVYADYFQKRNK